MSIVARRVFAMLVAFALLAPGDAGRADVPPEPTPTLPEPPDLPDKGLMLEWHVWGELVETGQRVDLLKLRGGEPWDDATWPKVRGHLEVEVIVPADAPVRWVELSVNAKESKYRKRVRRYTLKARRTKEKVLRTQVPVGAIMFFGLQCGGDGPCASQSRFPLLVRR